MTALPLDAETLIDAARERTGIDDLGGDEFREGLGVLIDGLEREAKLSEMGRAIVPEMVLLPYLTTRLEVHDWHAQHPAAANEDVDPIVVMIGMGRTGTTILHDLLAQDPRNRVPRTWEVDHPVPPPETATYYDDPRIDEVQAGIEAARAVRPELQAMHPMGARLAQECVRITGSEFASLIFLAQFRSSSYLHWLLYDADLTSTYRFHRRFLQLLQSHHRTDRWIVKSGAHLWALPSLLTEYPNARFVQTHRDPVRVIASLASLFAALHTSFSDDVSVPAVANDWAGPILEALDNSVTAREDGSIPSDRVVDVPYDAFMADPIAQLGRIYDFFGAELTSDVESRMRGFLADNAVDKHGRHSYTFADTGLDDGALRERAKRYTDYFDVAPEPFAR
jgi:hypothetical protein